MPKKAVERETTTYASVADVQSLVPVRKFGQGSNPSGTDVQLYLELVEAEVHAILVQKGYAVPVAETNTAAFALLRRICALGAVAQVEASAGNGPNIDRTRITYEAEKSRLEDAHFVMNAPKDEERAKPRGPGVTTVPLPEDVETGEGVEPFFKRSAIGTMRGTQF
jgi:hypothetical protein